MNWLNSNRMRLLLVGVVAAMLISGGSAKADFTFGTPKNLGWPVNSPNYEAMPCISADGLELYFASNWKYDGYGDYDIWVLTRETTDDEWSEPNNLGELVNSPLSEFQPAISTDGLELYIEAWERAPSGSSFTGGISVTRRSTRNDPWDEPVMLDLAVPDGYVAGAPSISADGLELYFSLCRFSDEPEAELYVTKRETKEALWGVPVSLGPVVNNWTCQANSRISSDGLLLIFSDWWLGTPRLGGFGDTDLWITRRATKDSDWGEPVNLGSAINTAFGDDGGMISADGSTFYFCSNRFSAPYCGWYQSRDNLYQAPILPVVDFDGDGIVGMNDLLILIGNWGSDDSQCDIGPMAWGDGVVDAADLEALMKYWGKDMTGLVAHWKLDEAEGTTAYDSAGNNDANLVGDPVWQPTSGWVDGALELDGVDEGAEAGFALNLSESQFSAFAWIKGGGPDQVIISQARTEISFGVNWLMANPTTGCLMTELTCLHVNYVRGPYLVSFAQITDGQWHHVGLVWDLFGTRVLYVDGVEVAKDTLQEGTMFHGEEGGINIGFQASVMHRPGYWSGLIDDVRIYDKALTPEQIAELAQ